MAQSSACRRLSSRAGSRHLGRVMRWQFRAGITPKTLPNVSQGKCLHTAVASSLQDSDPGQAKSWSKALVHSQHNALIDSAKLNTQLENRESFAIALKEFMAREKYRRGHVNFLKLALHRMDEFGLQRNLLTYNRLFDIFPKGRFVARRMLDAFWPRSLPQTELALEILTKMEEQSIRPDYNTYMLLTEIFGKTSLPVQKCYRIAYWFDKYEHADPYRIDGTLPSDPVQLARLALGRIVSKDGQLTEYKLPSEAKGDSYILGASTPDQLELLGSLTDLQGVLLYVEGPHRIWLQKVPQFYYSLRLSKDSVLKEEEGPLLAVCMCHPGTQECLQRWMSALEDTYPSLGKATVIYDIREDEAAGTSMKLLQNNEPNSILESASI